MRRPRYSCRLPIGRSASDPDRADDGDLAAALRAGTEASAEAVDVVQAAHHHADLAGGDVELVGQAVDAIALGVVPEKRLDHDTGQIHGCFASPRKTSKRSAR